MCSYILHKGDRKMRMVASVNVAEGITVKVGELLIVGVKKSSGVENNESRNIPQGINGNASRRRLFVRSTEKSIASIY